VALAEGRGLDGLVKLTLFGNPLGDQAALAFARSPRSARLRELSLANCGLGEEGLRALARSDHLAGLCSLGVYNNPGVEAAKEEFCARFGERALI
jgi:hypothetical protein